MSASRRARRRAGSTGCRHTFWRGSAHFPCRVQARREQAMDDQVLKAMARWHAVPAVFGWLRLDRRGGWHLVDLNKPGFDEAQDGLGSPISSPQILEFIERNYGHDELGRWYWQNGPQRAFVDIEAAPL